EMIRDSLRDSLYQKLTVNGFTPEVEDEILRIAATPDTNDVVWETEEDIKRDFDKLRKKIQLKSSKDKKDRQLYRNARKTVSREPRTA
ncbi:MAG: hypothetical protein Q7S79_03580, partial [bacterium]|nr:hypothetical protein [bacterium]